jgi:hypothetical protein
LGSESWLGRAPDPGWRLLAAGRNEQVLDLAERHSDRVDKAGVEKWIRANVMPVGPLQTFHVRPWATVVRVPLAEGVAWFKASGAAQAFETALTTQLFSHWPDRVPTVLACDQDRSWLLLNDAGSPLADLGNPPQRWLTVLPLYAELQRGESPNAEDHLRRGVPDLGAATLAFRYEQLLHEDLPLSGDEMGRLCRFQSRFERLCADLVAAGIPDTIQHDDLHMNNVYVRNDVPRVIDWGDSCVSHPFASLVATFRFLEERNRLARDDPWFVRLRDAYLEPWGTGLTDTFDLAIVVGGFAHVLAGLRQRGALSGAERAVYNNDFAVRLRRALAAAGV